MSSQSSTSCLDSLNESSSTKYGLEPYMHERTISNKIIFFFFFFFFYLFRCPTSYERAQNTRLHR